MSNFSCADLVEEKRKQFLKEKQRQLLRENNHELKELEMKLRTAYVAKSLKSQIVEKEAIRKELHLKQQQDSILLNAVQKDEELIKTENEMKAKKKACLKNDILHQIALVQQERGKRYEQFLKEKKILDEITCKIQEEQLEEMRQELLKKVRYKSDIDEFCRIQKAWSDQQKKDMLMEDKRLFIYFEEKERNSKEMDDKRRQDLAAKEQISYKIGQNISQAMEAKQKREEVLRELYAAEKCAKEEEEIRKKLENQLRRRIQLRTDLDRNRKEIVHRKKLEEEKDKIFYEKQMQILAERDKIEQMSNEKRRRKVLEHRKELQKCLDEKKKKRAEEVADLLKQQEKERQDDKTRQQLIEEERMNLLKEHAKNLLGYLPAGILKESDREFLALPKLD